MKKTREAKNVSRRVEYLIPRNGTICRVTLYGRNELLAFRAELALLQRIANVARFQAPTRPVEDLKTLTPEAYLELDQILHDASHPLVETTIARVDRDFTGLRKDIDMSAVDEEAKKIVAEATAAGINMTDAPGEDDSSDLVDAMSISEAFDVAEAGLAAAVAADYSLPAEGATPPESASSSSVPQTPAEDAVGPGEPEQTDTAAIEPTGMEENVADALSEPVEAPEISESNAPSAQASSTARDTAVGVEDVGNAVAVIEQGIQNLAAMLKSELQDQWTRAHKTLDEVDCSRIKMDKERKATREMLEEISRLRDETRTARDEAEVARRDAKQQREAARIAKERAETSAAAAELAADQAGREATAIQDAGPPDADG